MSLLLPFAVAATSLAACVDDSPQSGAEDAIECPAEAEVCGYRDGGWDGLCVDGVVTIRSYNTTLYCAPQQSSEVLCESEPPPDMQVHTCSSGCAKDKVYLETVEEYNAFVPASMCQS